MKNKIYPVTLSIIFLFIFFLFYKGLQKSNIYTPDVNIEKNVPSFAASIFDTKKTIVSNEIFKSKEFYLLNVWSSWCVPCKDEHPFLMDLSEQKNIEIIGLNYKDNYSNAKIFLKDFSNPYKLILSDNDGLIAIEWGAYGVPESFLISDKKIIKKIIGPIDSRILAEIKKIIR
tara:strand:- start:867 stop:1385 length:519 start_codon:yes stop_codon:yes gene_type:complete